MWTYLNPPKNREGFILALKRLIFINPLLATECMEDRYDPQTAEPKWQEFWQDQGIYRFDPKSKKELFSVDTPPPTVSGHMHMGHALGYTQCDFIVRFHRMLGKNIFYPFGFDDNGLATERFVEKKKNVKGTKMSRPEFVKLCLEFTKETEEQLKASWSRLGISPDWSLYYQTISPATTEISQRSFVELHEKGRIYRKDAPIMWCPSCQTAIAQVEAKDSLQQSTMNYIRAKVGNDTIVFATTRPEMMPACVAMTVHPEDNRYKKYIGKKATLPLFNRQVTIYADEKTKMDKGSGVVYWCTYGGIDDVEYIVQRHDLSPIHVMNVDGSFNELAGPYKGLKSKEARKKIVQDLQNADAIEKIETISHAVNVHERCDTDIEFISTMQWFIKYLDLKDTFLELGARLNWYPAHMKVRYDNWVKGLKWDWCISRQRFFGVPVPVWYCRKCDEPLIASIKELPVDPTTTNPKGSCKKCKGTSFIPEKDVLDTWATSSLTPQIAGKWGKDKELFGKVFPMSLRSNGHDIITFWLFNTVVKSYLHEGKLPWKDVMINGFVLDPQGNKMSKSKGNVIDPLQQMQKFSADALRWWAASTKLGDDNPFQEKELVAGTRMITKLCNAAKFASLHMVNHKKMPTLQLIDSWILAKLSQIIKESSESFVVYEFNRTKLLVEKFFWQDWCDNYLEMVKDRLYSDKRTPESKKSAQYTLYHGTLMLLKLLAPLLPHITEELFQQYFVKSEHDKSIHCSSWPAPFVVQKDDALQIGNICVEILSAVRKVKSQKQISLKSPVAVLKVSANMSDQEWMMVKEDILAATIAASGVFNQQKELDVVVEF